MKEEIRLRIAETVILLQSSFPLVNLAKGKRKASFGQAIDAFLSAKKCKPDIIIEVKVADSLPVITNIREIFVTYNYQNGEENWRLFRGKNVYVYKSVLENRQQMMLVNKDFNRVVAYLPPKKNNARLWNAGDVVYDFLQILLISYFAKEGKGVFSHAIGMKDCDGSGLIFAGKSGAGKTTMARLWHKYSRAVVLNDDRMIIRKIGNEFYVFGSPWHGEFNDYRVSNMDGASANKIFFIYHNSTNKLRKISGREALGLLYPVIFPTFWDKGCLENILSFCCELVGKIQGYSLGFVNDKSIVKFIRRS